MARKYRLSQILKAVRATGGWLAPAGRGVDSVLAYLDEFPEPTIVSVACSFDVTLPWALQEKEQGDFEPMDEYVERLSAAALRIAKRLRLEPDGPEAEAP